VDADTLALENLDRWWFFYRKGLITRRELFQAVLVAGGAAGAAGLLSGTSPQPWIAAPASAATMKDTVTLHLNSDVPNLDPHMHILREEIIIMYHMFNNLGTRDLKTMKIGPDLATSWKIVSPTVWEMDLRQGVRFHNGDPFTADTVKFNYDRVLNPAQKSPQRGNHEAIDHVEILNPYKVRIVTKRPYPIFVERLQNFQMHSEKYVKDKGDAYVAEHPVGTGPYKFVDWKRGSEVNVVRNDDYFGPKAAIPHAKFRIITDVNTAVAELLAGNVDIVRYVPTDQIATINRSGHATAKIQKILRVEYVALDAAGRSGTNPFQDKRVRQAANYAIDADLYLKRLQPGGDKTPAALNPMHFGFDPSIPPYSHNPDMARKLLAEAGYKNGFDARWLTSNLGMPSYQNVYDAMTQDLSGVGIRARTAGSGSHNGEPAEIESPATATTIRDTSKLVTDCYLRGSSSTTSSQSSASAMRSSVSIRGGRPPRSSRAIADCVVPQSSASSRCESPFAPRSAATRSAIRAKNQPRSPATIRSCSRSTGPFASVRVRAAMSEQ